eukprot:PhM_4_TR8822/c0_g1_i5/m.43716
MMADPNEDNELLKSVTGLFQQSHIVVELAALTLQCNSTTTLSFMCRNIWKSFVTALLLGTTQQAYNVYIVAYLTPATEVLEFNNETSTYYRSLQPRKQSTVPWLLQLPNADAAADMYDALEHTTVVVLPRDTDVVLSGPGDGHKHWLEHAVVHGHRRACAKARGLLTSPLSPFRLFGSRGF